MASQDIAGGLVRERVAGFHTEYSGFRWALYFLAEYANIFVVSAAAVTLFWGGWWRRWPSSSRSGDSRRRRTVSYLTVVAGK